MAILSTAKTAKRLVVLLVLVLMAALLHTIWPLLFYPQTTLSFTRQAPQPPATHNYPVAGVAEGDLTPPVGIPKFGYSAWSRPADGFRTRLKVRAFYLNSPGQTPLALVQLDLGSGSLPLHYRVAELIAASTDVPAHGLTLLSTHTHSGPGQFLGSNFYNLFGSNLPGFDPALFEFLSQQIADTVIAAYQQRREATLAIGQRTVYGLTRNRSLGAWQQNPQATDDGEQALLARQAVNPTMTMLRIDQRNRHGEFEPAGALTLFSIHGTGIAPFTRPYHADVWHWLSAGLNQPLRSLYPDFVHGAAQATHGDNTPAWIVGARGDRETRRIGQALGEHAQALFHSLDTPRSDWQLAAASREVDLLATSQEQSATMLCPRAAVGTTVVGAAKGDEVIPLSYMPPFRAGSARSYFTDSCQGKKYWMLSALQRLLPAQHFPHRALFQVIRINDLVIAPLPWEVTFESGNRLRDAIRAEFSDGADLHIEIASLANGYLGYAVTPEEYHAQYYEGGHTLYGPNTLPFLVQHSGQLAADLARLGQVDEIPRHREFTLLSRDYFQQRQEPEPVQRRLLGQPQFHDAIWDKEAHWAVQFQGELPAALPLHQPLLAVHCHNHGHPFQQTDDSGDLALRWLESDQQGGRYLLRWYPPAEQPLAQCTLQLRASHSGTALQIALPDSHRPDRE